MTKLKKLKKELKLLGFYFLREGKHEVWTNGIVHVALPHQKEIPNPTAAQILKRAREAFAAAA